MSHRDRLGRTRILGGIWRNAKDFLLWTFHPSASGWSALLVIAGGLLAYFVTLFHIKGYL